VGFELFGMSNDGTDNVTVVLANDHIPNPLDDSK